jgi:hypothetical protein
MKEKDWEGEGADVERVRARILRRIVSRIWCTMRDSGFEFKDEKLRVHGSR